MEKTEFIPFISEKIKLVRAEQDISQEKMAEMLGLSKKTLVQIEKRRTDANWTTIIAFCALFNDSEYLNSIIGDRPLELVYLFSNMDHSLPKSKTMGGRIWWKEIERRQGFSLQQNMISHHYRILDGDGYRWFSTFDEKESVRRLNELAKNQL